MKKGLIIFVTVAMLLTLSTVVFADPSPGGVGDDMLSVTYSE